MRTTEALFKDWNTKGIPSDKDLQKLIDEATKAKELAIAFNAGGAVVDYYFRILYSLEQAMWHRKAFK